VSQPYQQAPSRPGYAPVNLPLGGPPPPQAPGYPQEPLFQVRVAKHTGALIFWMSRRATVTGTYAQCDAAITAAQQHCLGAGWWSFGSLLWNPIAMSQNNKARTLLQQQARHHYDYAVWWNTYHGPGPSTPVWTPPPARPVGRNWWMWIPLALFLGFLVAMMITAANQPHHADRTRSDRHWQSTSVSLPLSDGVGQPPATQN
jgi:hypothetical protein